MKTIMLLRHAKSDWDANYGDDHDRPLAGRGRKAAKRVGKLLAGAGNVPDIVYSSTAVRARTTVEIAKDSGDWHCDIVLRRELYGAGVGTILALARTLPASVNTVLFAGHEPGWSHAVEALCGGGSVRMPTACLARIDFQATRWELCREGAGMLTQLIPPKSLD